MASPPGAVMILGGAESTHAEPGGKSQVPATVTGLVGRLHRHPMSKLADRVNFPRPDRIAVVSQDPACMARRTCCIASGLEKPLLIGDQIIGQRVNRPSTSTGKYAPGPRPTPPPPPALRRFGRRSKPSNP